MLYARVARIWTCKQKLKQNVESWDKCKKFWLRGETFWKFHWSVVFRHQLKEHEVLEKLRRNPRRTQNFIVQIVHNEVKKSGQRTNNRSKFFLNFFLALIRNILIQVFHDFLNFCLHLIVSVLFEFLGVHTKTYIHTWTLGQDGAEECL